MKLLNIGCGRIYNEAWVNIDVSPSSPDVLAFDLRRGLSFPDSSFDVVYHSHVLEHLNTSEAKQLIAECWRVLKPNGILRVVVPDLEAIARHYLDALEKANRGDKEAEENYDWILLELFDQVVRTVRGGEMLKHLRKGHIKNKDFIISRVGIDVENTWNQDTKTYKKLLWQKLKSQKISWFIKQSRNTIAGIFVAVIAGRQGLRAFQEGLFRNSGEIHRWMYDQFSIKRMLQQAGFVEVRVCAADESSIPEFNSYNLDISKGKVRKPDSLFIEAFKV